MATIDINTPAIPKQKIGEGMLYAAIWSLVYLIPIMNDKLMSEIHVNVDNLITAWIKITPFFALFLLNALVLIPTMLFSERKRVGMYVASALAVITVSFVAVEVYEIWNINRFDIAPVSVESRHASLTDLEWYWNIMLALFMFGANVGIHSMYVQMRQDMDLALLREEKVHAEMYYLKHQINPHFMMNTLNNILALIEIDAEAAKKAVIELSGMMRYTTYESSSHTIPLAKDIEFLKNYIELMRVRYLETVDVRLNTPHSIPPEAKIPPLVLIVFVENAFKHGVSYSENSFIYIDIECRDKSVHASFRNSVHPAAVSKGEFGGVGLENVRKRLDLLFGEEYKLTIDPTQNDVFLVELDMPFVE